MIKLISKLPLGFLLSFSPLLSFILHRIIGYRKEVVRENLALAFSNSTLIERQKVEKGFYKNLSIIILEILKMPSLSTHQFSKRCSFEVSTQLQEEIKKGKSFIMMGTHLGNWEYAVYAPTLLLDLPLDTLYQPLNNPFFEKMMHSIRSRFGMHPMPMQTAFKTIVKNKDNKRVFGFASDQSPQKSKIQFYHTFFGKETPFQIGAEKIANRLNLPVMYVCMKRTKKGYYHFKFDLLSSPNNKNKNTKDYPIMKKYINQIEKDIKANPSDWLWSHKRWKHSL